MRNSNITNIRTMGIFLALFGLMGTIVNATDPYITQRVGTLTIYATCEGIDFAKLTVKDGIVGASALKKTFNDISLNAGQEEIRKLNYSGPSFTPGSIRMSTKVGLFTGTWLREEQWSGYLPGYGTSDDDSGTPRTIQPKREQPWLETLQASWEIAFVKELVATGRPSFVRAQRCSLKYTKVEK